MVFETVSGDRLIGVSVEPSNESIHEFFGVPDLFTRDSFDGIFIFRTRANKITYLSHSEISRTRPVTIFDTEYDSSRSHKNWGAKHEK